jgi:signal transduction histidine kinase
MTPPTRWSVRQWALLLIVLEAVLLVAAITSGLVGLNSLAAARTRVVDELDPQLLHAQNLTTALLNQETGVRGYLLTGQQSFREPYDSGRREQEEAVTALRGLGATDGTPVGDDLSEALVAVGDWQRTADQLLGSTAPAPTDLVERGKTQFDTVRASLGDMQSHLAAARETDRINLYDSATLLSVVLGTIAVLVVILFILLVFGFHRTIVAPILRLAGEVRGVTDDINRPIPTGVGPRELDELSGDVETMRQRIVDEVNELRHAHELLDQRSQELERSNSDLEQFAYVASHDLQEPLRKVTSFCQLLERRYKGQLDERGEQYIAFAVDGAKRMQILINDLLAFSRVGRRSAEHVKIDSDELLDDALRNLSSAIEDSGAEITRGELPEVWGEPSLLTAVFQNLVSNAIKFHGDQPPRIHVEAVRSDEDWTFSVTDNGIGIDDEYAERIFVIFQRLHAKDAYPGTGIGLALSRKIIEYHGGQIWLDTAAGDGQTRFSFTLPAADHESEDTDDRGHAPDRHPAGRG